MASRTRKVLQILDTQSIKSERLSRKVKISLRIPEPLHEDIVEAMKRDHYSPKKKSVWTEEALFVMARHDPDLSESLVGDRAQGPNTKQIVVALSSDARHQLRDSIVRLRLQLPTIEGVQSLVLRCAMRFRIRHPEYFPIKE